MTLQEAQQLALKVLKDVMEEKLDAKNVQLASVTKEMVSTPDFEGQMVEKDAKPKQQQKEKESAEKKKEDVEKEKEKAEGEKEKTEEGKGKGKEKAAEDSEEETSSEEE